MSKPFLIIHGHFYQPPREEPYSLKIERQLSAFPYRNWNERIDRECYAANAASRVLDDRGRIIDIVNNYEYISFNFGPTLLLWLKKEDPFTYERIIEADYNSRERNGGHGNAIAQVYNHVILPLAHDKDIITEIEWGLKAFEKDFGRTSEGLWLSETAVNDKVIEFLIEYGIKFIILSPFQAAEVFNDGKWIDVSDGSIDPSKPYLLEENNGKIAVFFYYKDIAQKVSFEHLLRNVNFLRGEILKYNSHNLIHFATDGEVYGHHEPFGDMCLARLIYENNKKEDLIFTNYGNYLAKFPPQDYVRLKKGNDGLGTSWSCVHGVDRWRKDCGCTTGSKEGWNQKWREPLRNALDYIRDRFFEKVEDFLTNYIDDIWHARNDYISVFYTIDYAEREKNEEEFLRRHLKKKISEDERIEILKFFEAFQMELFMYTSCGWFFADISGIETVQNLKYANQLLFLMKDYIDSNIKEEFLHILSKAKSNISEYGNGKTVFEEFVEKSYLTPEKIVFEYVLNLQRKIENFQNEEGFYYFYKMKVLEHKKFIKNNYHIERFLIESKNILTGEERKNISIVIFFDRKYFGFVKKYKDIYFLKYIDKIIKESDDNILQDLKDFLGDCYTLKDISQGAREDFLKYLFTDKMKKLHKLVEFSRNEFLSYLDVIELYGELKIPIPEIDRLVVRELLNNFVLQELSKIKSIDVEKYDFSLLIRTISIARKAELELDYTDILPAIREFVAENMEDAIIRLEISALKRLEKIIDVTNLSGIDFEKYEIQNLLFKKTKELIGNKSQLKKPEVKILLNLAEKFNIGVEEII